MIGKGLSLDQAPPFEAPLRFFLTAPLFAMLVGIITMFSDFSTLSSRYSPLSIGIVHLITLGFMAMVMLGAIQQMLPVVATVKLPKPLIISRVVHTALSFGVLFLSTGIASAIPLLVHISLYLLGPALIVFIGLCLFAMSKSKFKSETTIGLKLSLISGLITIILGLKLASAYAFLDFSPIRLALLDSHMFLGIFGFATILIIAISYVIVPMFYVTESFPKIIKKALAPLVFINVGIWGIAKIFHNSELTIMLNACSLVMAILLILFAGLSLIRFQTRKRPIIDTTIIYWYISLSCLIISMLLLLVNLFVEIEYISYLLAILMGGGFFLSLFSGMLYKIVPFLVWYHLTSYFVPKVPTMREMCPKKATQIQLYIHCLSLLLFLFSIYEHKAIIIAGFLFFISNLLLLINLIKPAREYFRLKGSGMDFSNSFAP